MDGRTGPQGGQEGAAAPAPHQAPVHVSSGQQDTCLSKAPFMDEPGTSHTSLNTSDVHGTAPPWPWATLSFWVPVAHDHVMVDGTTMAPRCQYRLSPGRCRGETKPHLFTGSLEDQPHTNAMGTGYHV